MCSACASTSLLLVTLPRVVFYLYIEVGRVKGSYSAARFVRSISYAHVRRREGPGGTSPICDGGSLPPSLSALDLEQQERVQDEEDREEDGRSIEVLLDHRAAAEAAAAGAADAEGTGETRVFPGVQQHEEDHDDRDDDLDGGEEREHERESLASLGFFRLAGVRPVAIAAAIAVPRPVEDLQRLFAQLGVESCEVRVGELARGVVELGVTDLPVLGFLASVGFGADEGAAAPAARGPEGDQGTGQSDDAADPHPGDERVDDHLEGRGGIGLEEAFGHVLGRQRLQL